MGNFYGRQHSSRQQLEDEVYCVKAAGEVLKSTSENLTKEFGSGAEHPKRQLLALSRPFQSQYNLYGLIQEENRRRGGRRKSWCGQPVRLHCISSKSNPSLNTSASFRSFSSNFSTNHTKKEDVERSAGDVARSVWPITQTETLFLPHFKIYERSLEKEFHVLNLIDSGAFGKVYFVQDKITNDNYALKVLSKANLINTGSVRQIRNEVDIQSICGHHPFIVECIAYWQNRTQIYILLEYVPNGELLKTIKVFPLELIQIYIAEIAVALDFLQNAGIIYRDLKPENILLDADYHIKLIDFGLSKWLRIGERTRTICGTTEYMAPEIFDKSGEGYGHAADWWSLGVICYLLFTKKFPVFQSVATNGNSLTVQNGTQSNATISSNASNLPNHVENIPPAAQDLMKRLFERNPRNRLRSVRELERIAMFYQFSFDDCRARKLQPIKYIVVP